MIERHYFGLPLLHFAKLDPFSELGCAVSTRRGPSGTSFDLGPVRGPQRGCRADHWKRLGVSLGLLDGVAPQLQVHGPDFVKVDGPAGDFHATPPADASFTDRPGIGLLAFSADCPLVAVYAPGRAVGVAHASWRCTATLIVQRLIERMADDLDCRPEKMWAAISPSAGPCCYEVGPEVYLSARRLPDREACFHRPAGPACKQHFNLWRAAIQQLVHAGVPETHIDPAGLCTICHNDQFFSFRREGDAVGSFGLMIGRRTQYLTSVR
jgi:YfiH family protein